MFGISFEHILIVGVILLIMGPKRLPELGNTMGKAIKNFKDSIAGIEEANYKRVAEAPKATTPVAAAPIATSATTVSETVTPVAAASVNPSQSSPNA